MQIAVVGCGWLGKPLALSLQKDGHNIVATSRSALACDKLTEYGFKAVKFQLGDCLEDVSLTPIFQSQLLILNIPVGRKQPLNIQFTQQIESFLQQSKARNVTQVIFISTTSVYGDNCSTVTQTTPSNPQTISARINLEVEKLVSLYFPIQSTVLRPAGLVGHDRHPARYLAGRSNLSNGQQRVNLIHQYDVIQAIRQVVQQNIWQQMLLLCAEDHPTRADYYTWAAQQLALEPPEFSPQQVSTNGKLVDARNSLKLLGITLKYPSPYDMIKG
jgi:nucleoside-diphosphate-sugar epimerase